MSAPARLAAWSERHPAERGVVREVLEGLVDRELTRRSEQKVAARIKAARFVQLQTVVSLRQPESHLVFQVISVRHDRRKPTVVTTNRTFGEWNQIFADDAVAHAILDRLAERAEVFHLEGTSYRETHRRPAPKASPS